MVTIIKINNSNISIIVLHERKLLFFFQHKNLKRKFLLQHFSHFLCSMKMAVQCTGNALRFSCVVEVYTLTLLGRFLCTILSLLVFALKTKKSRCYIVLFIILCMLFSFSTCIYIYCKIYNISFFTQI